MREKSSMNHVEVIVPGLFWLLISLISSVHSGRELESPRAAGNRPVCAAAAAAVVGRGDRAALGVERWMVGAAGGERGRVMMEREWQQAGRGRRPPGEGPGQGRHRHMWASV